MIKTPKSVKDDKGNTIKVFDVDRRVWVENEDSATFVCVLTGANSQHTKKLEVPKEKAYQIRNLVSNAMQSALMATGWG